MIGWVFPGQGSQRVGMTAGLNSRIARETLSSASEVLGWDLVRACEEGPPKRLDSTEVTQPAVFTVNVAAARTLEDRGLRPDGVAGHSVGEFAALVVAGVLSFEDALRGVVVRGEAMHRAGRSHPGGMVAILGLSAERVAALCAHAAGVAVTANLNGPDQVVVSGDEAGISQVAAAARAEDARAIRLKVSVAAHSPLVASVQDELAAVLREVPWSPPRFPVYSGVDGRAHERPEELA